MRQARAIPLPNEALNVEEIKFWLKIMQEHTEFIRAGLPIDANDYYDASKEFHRAFTSLLQKAERLKSIKQSSAFISEVGGIMEEFQRYQRQLLADRLCCKLSGSLFPFFLDHIIREAKCFSDLLLRIQEGETALRVTSHTREIVVWLRCMADHTRLICHYVDPSERRIEKMALEFAELFDSLVLEGRDLASMLYCHKGEVRAFHRFLLDVRLDVQRLRDFNKMAEDLINGCRLLGIMNVALAAHMKREAEHCLLIIALLEKEIVKHCPDDFQDDLEPGFYSEYERLENETQTEADDMPCEVENEFTALDTSTEEIDGCAFPADGELRDVPDALPERQAEEPVVAILPLRTLNEATQSEPEPLTAQAAVKSVTIASEQAPILDAQAKELGAEEQKSEAIPFALQSAKDRLHDRIGEQQNTPNKLAGRTPGERCSKKKEQRLPRSLGKLRM